MKATVSRGPDREQSTSNSACRYPRWGEVFQETYPHVHDSGQVCLFQGTYHEVQTRRALLGCEKCSLGEKRRQPALREILLLKLEELPDASGNEIANAPNQLLVEIAHLKVRHCRWVKVDLGKSGDDQVEEVRSIKAGDLRVEIKLVKDLPSTGREASNVGLQVPGNLNEARR